MPLGSLIHDHSAVCLASSEMYGQSSLIAIDLVYGNICSFNCRVFIASHLPISHLNCLSADAF